jgi:hypothetical protein
MVLLGVDILRMYNNRKTFDANKQKCGFFHVSKPSCAAQEDIPVCAAGALGAQDTQLYSEVHNMHEHDLYGIGALLATLLLAHRMEHEGLEVPIVGAGGVVGMQPFAVPPLNRSNDEASNSACMILVDMFVPGIVWAAACFARSATQY